MCLKMPPQRMHQHIVKFNPTLRSTSRTKEMQPAYHTPSSTGDMPFPSYRYTKANVQKQYRRKEGECVSTLREVIKELTGKKPHTRQEVLRKAIDLLEIVIEVRRPDSTQAVSPDPAGTPYLSDGVHSGDLTQSFHELQAAQFDFNVGFYGQNPSYIPDSIAVSGMDFGPTTYMNMEETHFPFPTAQTVDESVDLSLLQESILATYFLPQSDASFSFERVQHF